MDIDLNEYAEALDQLDHEALNRPLDDPITEGAVLALCHLVDDCVTQTDVTALHAWAVRLRVQDGWSDAELVSTLAIADAAAATLTR
jgi:hypothetical protein